MREYVMKCVAQQQQQQQLQQVELMFLAATGAHQHTHTHAYYTPTHIHTQMQMYFYIEHLKSKWKCSSSSKRKCKLWMRLWMRMQLLNDKLKSKQKKKKKKKRVYFEKSIHENDKEWKNKINIDLFSNDITIYDKQKKITKLFLFHKGVDYANKHSGVFSYRYSPMIYLKQMDKSKGMHMMEDYAGIEEVKSESLSIFDFLL